MNDYDKVCAFMEMVEENQVDARALALHLLEWMGVDEVIDFIEREGYDNLFEDEEIED